MAKNKISGNILGLEIDGKFIACETSCELSYEADMRGASSETSGGWKEWLPAARSWSVNLNASALLQTTGSDYRTVLDAFINRKRMKMRFKSKKVSVSNFAIIGFVYAQNGTFNATVNTNVGYTNTFIGDGPFQIGDPSVFVGSYGFRLTDPFGDELNLKPQFSKEFNSGANSISLDFSVPSAGNFLFAIVPHGQPIYNEWTNNAFNYGPIPDYLWRMVTIGNYDYYMTRNIQYITSAVPVIVFNRKATAPTAFTFNSVLDVAPGTVQTSNVITLSGMIEPLILNVTNGLVSINGGPFVGSGTVNNGDTLQAQQTAPNGFGQNGVTTVTVGSFSTGFNVSTKVAQPILLRTSVVQGNNPFAQAGYSINGAYIIQPEPSTNNFDGLFQQGDTLVVDFTSLLHNYPWEDESQASMTIKVNDAIVYSIGSVTQAISMGGFTINTDGSTNKIEIDVLAGSSALGRTTRYLNTYLYNIATGQFRIQINDDVDSRAKLNVYPIANGNRLRFNTIDSGSTVTAFLENPTLDTLFIYIEGTGFANTYTLYPLSIVEVNGIPKSELYLFDVEMNGYVRRADFTKNNCGSGVGGIVPFAKAYSDEAAANADTVNFNNLGQARANQFGSCS